jgi:HEAT repeat protein
LASVDRRHQVGHTDLVARAPVDKREVTRHLDALLRPESTDGAMDALEELGPGALPFLFAAVVDTARPERVRELAACTASRIDGGAQRLAILLEDADDNLADIAAFAVRWPPASLVAEPVLVAMLADPDPRRRLRGLRGLGYIGIDLSKIHPAIEAARRDPDPAVRAEAERILEIAAQD